MKDRLFLDEKHLKVYLDKDISKVKVSALNDLDDERNIRNLMSDGEIGE